MKGVSDLSNSTSSILKDEQGGVQSGEGGVYLGFFLAFLLCTGIATAAFVGVWYMGWVGNDAGTVADALGAILGVSVALSGSAVALALAVRALRHSDQSNRLSEQMAQLTHLSAELQRQRAADFKVERIMGKIETLAASTDAVLASARELYRSCDIAQTELAGNRQAIEDARSGAVEALLLLAQDLSEVSRETILDAAWRAHARQIQDDHSLIAHYREMMRSFRRREEVWASWQDDDYEDWVQADINREAWASNDSGFNDEKPSEWLSLEGEVKVSDQEDWSEFPAKASEFALMFREMAAELNATTAQELWHRMALARYALFLQARAVYDTRTSGGYHMAPSTRRQRDLTRGILGPKLDFDNLVLDRAWVIMSNRQTRFPADPLIVASLLAPPFYPLHAVEHRLRHVVDPDLQLTPDEVKSLVAKPEYELGRLERQPLAMNQAALKLVQLATALPDGEAVAEASRKVPELGDLILAGLDKEKVDQLARRVFHPVLAAAVTAPDKIFHPLPVDPVDYHARPQRDLTFAFRKLKASAETEEEHDDFLRMELHPLDFGALRKSKSTSRPR